MAEYPLPGIRFVLDRRRKKVFLLSCPFGALDEQLDCRNLPLSDDDFQLASVGHSETTAWPMAWTCLSAFDPETANRLREEAIRLP